MSKLRIDHFTAAIAAITLLAGSSVPAQALDVTGTITLQGNVVFAAPIPGIALTDLTVSSGPGIEAIGNGQQCSIDAAGSAPVDALGAYPASGALSVTLTIGRGGNNAPDGSCLLQVRAGGNDGGNVSAYGTTTVEVSVAQIDADAAVVVPTDIVVRQSKTVAGLSKDCLKYTKKQMKARAKCNRTLWMFGGAEGSLKCKAAEDEPLDCDPANYSEEVVATAFGGMNQQVDPPTAVAIEYKLIPDQAKCQKSIGQASVNFVASRNQRIQKNCIDTQLDDDACRAQAVADSRAKLTPIDKCVGDQVMDGMSGLVLPQVAEPCESQCLPGGILNRKCLKDCLQLELSTLSDLLIGDVPECGNGILQAGEFCDDGNVASGDCCSATCTNEPVGSQTCGVGYCEVTVDQCAMGAPVVCTPGAPGVEAGYCADGIDNDCDGLVDAADLVDCP